MSFCYSGSMLFPVARLQANVQPRRRLLLAAAPVRMHRAGHLLSSAGKLGVALALTAIVFGSRGVGSASSSNGTGGTPVGAREVIGCTSGGTGDVAHGSRGRRIVALTFDDGPSLSFTPSILAILDRLHARGTFFEEGRHVTNREALMRRILASGDEIANHSFDHPRYPGYTELATTNRLIRRRHRVHSVPLPAAIWPDRREGQGRGTTQRASDRPLGR